MSEFPHIYWTPCVVHTLNLALKNICAPKDSNANERTYEACKWITEVHGDAMQIKNFIMNHNMRFYSDEWLVRESARLAPHRDGEISRERMKCFRRLFTNDDDHGKVMKEYAQFSMKVGPFEDLTCISNMYSMDPRCWWANFGAQTPLLQSLAFKLLAQSVSSSCCERNWSTYAFIHSLRRNKLNSSRAQDLVYIHKNLRLLSRNSEQYNQESTKMWDVGGDIFDSMEDVGFLEFAELSLDEPDFENALLEED